MRPMRYIVVILATILVALLIWANQWEYFQWQTHLMRVNRFTSVAYELSQGGQWVRH